MPRFRAIMSVGQPAVNARQGRSNLQVQKKYTLVKIFFTEERFERFTEKIVSCVFLLQLIVTSSDTCDTILLSLNMTSRRWAFTKA